MRVFQRAVVSTGVDLGCGTWWRRQCSRRGVRYSAVAQTAKAVAIVFVVSHDSRRKPAARPAGPDSRPPVPAPRDKGSQETQGGAASPLPAVLALAVCAMLSGGRSLYAIARHGREHPPSVGPVFGVQPGTDPVRGHAASCISPVVGGCLRSDHRPLGQESLDGARRPRAPSSRSLATSMPA